MSNDNKYSKYTNPYGQTIPGVGYKGDSAEGDEYSIEDMEQHLLVRRVLSAKQIDKESFAANIDRTLLEIDSRIVEVNEDLASINRDLEETNSEQFYYNTTAIAQRDKLTKMQEDLVNLSNKINQLRGGEIFNKIDEYNKDLPEMKKGEEMTLMMKQADRINAKKKQVGDPSEPRYLRYNTKPQTKTVQNDDKATITETTYTLNPNGYTDMSGNEYIVIDTKYEHIDYSDLISGPPEWPWGEINVDDIKEFQRRITSLEYNLDYDPTIVDYDE